MTVKALRLYDHLGILAAASRSDSNYRLFGEEAVCCVQLIRALQEAGFKLRDLQELAAAHREGADVRALLPQLVRQVSQRLDEQIGRLEASRARLQRLRATPAALCCQPAP